MKKLVAVLFLLLSFISINAQKQAEFSIGTRGSNITGILGAEIQYGRFSIAESWRPVTTDVHSFITTVNMFFDKSEFFMSYPYISLSYSTKGIPYLENPEGPGYDNVKHAQALSFLMGFKTIITDDSQRVSGKAGLGITLSEKRSCFSFEVGLNFILFRI